MRFQVFGVTVPFTPCSKHIMFYGLGMCDCTLERDKIYGKFVISSEDYDATLLGSWDAVFLLE